MKWKLFWQTKLDFLGKDVSSNLKTGFTLFLCYRFCPHPVVCETFGQGSVNMGLICISAYLVSGGLIFKTE